MNNLLVKYADDITISVPVRQSTDTAAAEVEYMKKWADINEKKSNRVRGYHKRKSNGVKDDHKKKSDGVRVKHEKDRWGES